MAEHASEYTPGHMDIRQQQRSFEAFVLMTKWGSLAVAVGVLFFTIWFCTDAGFLGGFIPAVVLATLGILFLRGGGAAPGH
jgi:hypothetical protein